MSQEPVAEEDELKTKEEREKVKCTIFLGYTSNMISSGIREVIRFLVQHKMVTTIRQLVNQKNLQISSR